MRLFCLLVVFFTSLIGSGVSAQLAFLPNQGQWETEVLYRMDHGQYSLFLEERGLTYAFFGKTACHGPACSEAEADLPLQGHALKVHFAGAKMGYLPEGQARMAGYHNYYLGKNPAFWAEKVPLYQDVTYREIYDGVQLLFYSKNGQLKYDFVVEAGKSSQQIRLHYDGAMGMALDKAGNLRILTSVGEVLEEKPFAYQQKEIGGQLTRQPVSCTYVLTNDTLSFAFPEGYDPGLDLIIDPSLVFGTYSGASSSNWGFTATYDSKGHGYAGGIIFSRIYPTTAGAFQSTYQGGDSDITLSKFSADGSRLLFSTYLGGSAAEQPHSMVTGVHDELYLFGRTFSPDFPVSETAYDTSYNGQADLYVTKLDSNGQFLASTFLGGTNDEGAIYRGGGGQPRWSPLYVNYGDDARGEIDLDDRGNCYIATVTASQDFPIATLPIKSFSGQLDACIAKFNSDLSELLWSSYFGGSQDDAVVSLAVVAEDQLFVTGTTQSADFPISSQAVTPVFQGVTDCFVARLDLASSSLLASTYIGSDTLDAAFFVELDKKGDVYIYGQTLGDIGLIGTPYNQPQAKQFITKLNPDLSTIIWQAPFGTLFSPMPDITPTAFLVDNCSRIYVAGWGPADFNTFQGVMPLTADAYQDTTDGSHFYLAVFEKDMDSLIYGTYFGELDGQAEHVDGGTSRFDKSGVVYQAVCASCGGTSNFPTTANAYRRTNGTAGSGQVGGGGCNVALFKMDFELPAVTADFVPEDQDGLPLYTGCVPFELQFNNTSTYGAGSSFRWDFGDGSPPVTGQNPLHTFSQKGQYQVSLIVTDPSSCNQADTIVKLIEAFTPAYADAGPDLEICAGQSIMLQADLSPGLDIRWSPATDLSHDSIARPLATPLESTTYYVYVSDQDACGELDSMVVTVYPQDSLWIMNDTTVCEGTSFSLRASGMDTYRWSPTSPVNNPFTPWPTANLSEATRFRVIGNEQRCPDTAYVRIEVIAQGQTTAIAEENPVCSGTIVWLQAAGGDRYVWSNGWGSDRIGPRVGEDTMVFSVTAYNGPCPARPASVQVDVVPHPVAEFVPVRRSNYAPVQISLVNRSQHATKYLWDFGLYGNQREIFEPEIVYPDSGTYRIRLWAWNELGCVDISSYTFQVLPTWLEIPTAFSPNGDNVNDAYTLPSFGLEGLDFQVFDRWGKAVFQTRDPNFRWDGTYKGQAVPEGVYVFVLKAYGLNGRLYERKGSITVIR